MRVALAADHNGVALRRALAQWLRSHGHEVEEDDAGGDAVVDYPPLCAALCRRVLSGTVDRGVVIGGSGSGETMACNKIAGIRATLCQDPFTATIARANNDANVLVLGAKVVDAPRAVELVSLFLSTDFRGGVHQRRLDMIAALERGEEI